VLRQAVTKRKTFHHRDAEFAESEYFLIKNSVLGALRASAVSLFFVAFVLRGEKVFRLRIYGNKRTIKEPENAAGAADRRADTRM
jgi:hypothetical protein